MKYLLSILILCNSVYSQTEVNLVGNYFPDMIPGEIGWEISEAEFPFQSWSFVQLPESIELIDVGMDSIQMKLTSFIIVIDDSTTSYITDYEDNYFTSYFYKDSIRITRGAVEFINVRTNKEVETRELYICHEPQFGYTCLIVIENINRWSCDYSLYYSDTCQMPSGETLVQYGKLRLRRNRKYRSTLN